MQKWHFCHFKCQFTFEALSFHHILFTSPLCLFHLESFCLWNFLIAFALYSFIMSQPKTLFNESTAVCLKFKVYIKKQILWIPLAWENRHWHTPGRVAVRNFQNKISADGEPQWNQTLQPIYHSACSFCVKTGEQ